ncbi:pyridoxal phosphate-dependent transferase [Photobacterium leiognathi]|uniref:pyridoxal phosphate-dependent transferase n=1 Tax=Photobacterium leiognathi TaxID=553611 RepID=UPI0029829723|nr:pyridoxal phosphate-dependent transferase [Photobacterium leiognathi]
MTYHEKTKLIGGEQELPKNDYYYGITNSGRSSLRWLILSLELSGKTILIPDFVCQIVIDVLLEFEVKIQFYSVDDTFEFSLPRTLTNIDAIYLVRYFGHSSGALTSVLEQTDRTVIIDDVFGIDTLEVKANVSWGYFNSLRKITPISDFSQIICSKPLIDIEHLKLSDFSRLKYKAKEKKHAFIYNNDGNEVSYLELFAQAEMLLDNSHGIFAPEDKSIYYVGCYLKNIVPEVNIRQQNLSIAKANLKPTQYIDIKPSFPSFLPLIVRNRDVIRKYLMKENIFLAVHWPKTTLANNNLSENILSLPLDGRYNETDIKYICYLISKLDV